MPIYEYRCEACGEKHDALQKISDPRLTDCPACGEPALKRLMSAPAFRLKGGGWYETDFKSDKEKKRNLVDSKPEATGKASTESSKDGGKKSEGAKSEGTKPSGDSGKSSSGKKEPSAKPAGGSEAA